jgi:hypothetical protein
MHYAALRCAQELLRFERLWLVCTSGGEPRLLLLLLLRRLGAPAAAAVTALLSSLVRIVVVGELPMRGLLALFQALLCDPQDAHVKNRGVRDAVLNND